jgi:hypothetical protein
MILIMASNESKCRDCGETLVWDDKNLTTNGKKFPVEKNGNRHNCPFSKFNKSQDKTLGDKTPMEALAQHERQIAELAKRLDTIEIEVRWGDAKTGTQQPKPKTEISWEKVEDPLEKYRK